MAKARKVISSDEGGKKHTAVKLLEAGGGFAKVVVLLVVVLAGVAVRAVMLQKEITELSAKLYEVDNIHKMEQERSRREVTKTQEIVTRKEQELAALARVVQNQEKMLEAMVQAHGKERRALNEEQLRQPVTADRPSEEGKQELDEQLKEAQKRTGVV